MNMELFSVFVTGANRGIGLEFVRQLARLNSPPKHIFATYRDPNTLQDLKAICDASGKNTNIHLIKMDVTSEDEMKKAAQMVKDIVKERGLTLLINNAGVANAARFPDLTKPVLDFHFSTNTVAPILLTQVLYPLLKQSAAKHSIKGMSFSKAGVLNISSMVGSINNTGIQFMQDLGVVGYKISKAALNMGMRAIASDAKNDNVIVITMCPGWVKTDMGTDRALIEPEESIGAMLSTISKLNEKHTGIYMDRFGEPIPY